MSNLCLLLFLLLAPGSSTHLHARVDCAMLIASHVRHCASQYAEVIMHLCRGNLNGNGNGNLNAGTYNGNHNGGGNLVRLVPSHTASLNANSDCDAVCSCPAIARLCCTCHAALASSECALHAATQVHDSTRWAAHSLPSTARASRKHLCAGCPQRARLMWPACTVDMLPPGNAVSNLGLILAGQPQWERQR